MDYLTICQKVNSRLGMQGTFTDNSLGTTVSSATGYQATIAAYTADAWVDIQLLKDNWDFMRTNVTLTTVASQTEYALTDPAWSATLSVGKWDTDMILYDDRPMRWLSYDYYIKSKQDEAGESEPGSFAIDPVDQHFYINPPRVHTKYRLITSPNLSYSLQILTHLLEGKSFIGQ